jgi:hypothetical protein
LTCTVSVLSAERAADRSSGYPSRKDLNDLASAVTVGVDTHKDVHVAVTLDELGRRLGVATFPTDDAHHRQLWQWAAAFGPVIRAEWKAQVASATGWRDS